VEHTSRRDVLAVNGIIKVVGHYLSRKTPDPTHPKNEKINHRKAIKK
jgi:hypothetical protein